MKRNRMERDNRLDRFFQVSGLYMDGDLRQKILKEAFVYGKKGSEESARYLRRILSSALVSGFRKGKAPESKIIGEFCRIEYWKSRKIDFFSIVDSWMKANHKRISQISKFMEKLDKSEIEQIKDATFQGDLPPIFENLVSTFRSEQSCKTDERIDVLFCAFILLNEYTKVASDVGPDNTDPGQGRDERLPVFWENLLEALHELPAEAEEWRFLEEFTNRATEIHDAKMKEGERQALIEPIVLPLKRLKAEAVKGLEYFGKTKAPDHWEPEACNPTKVGLAVSKINRLTEDLKKLSEPLRAEFFNIAEEEEAFEKRKKLRQEILQGFDALDELLGGPAAEKAPGEIAEEKADGQPTKLSAEGKEPSSPIRREETAAASAAEKDLELEPGDEAAPPSEAPAQVDEPESPEAEVDSVVGVLTEPMSWTPLMTCREIASVILQLDSAKRERGLCDLLWAELKEEHFGSAYWIAKRFESINEAARHFVPSWLVEFIAIARHLKHEYGPLALRLTKLAENFNESIFVGSEEWKNGMRFLMAGAMLRPAIVVPSIGASALLGTIRMKGDIENTYQICKAVIEFGNYGHSLNPMVLGTVGNRTAFKEQLNRMAEEASEWCQQAPMMSLIYQPATKVWIEWQKPDGLIFRLMQPVCNNDFSRKEAVREILKVYSDESNLKQAIDEKDREVRQVRKSSKSITGRGLSQIISHAYDAFEFARRWLALADKQLDGDTDWLTQQIDRLHNIFTRHSEPALDELAALKKDRSDSFCFSGGISVLEKAIVQSQQLFDWEAAVESGKEIPIAFLLNNDFIRIPTIRMKEDWTPLVNSPDEIATAIVENQAEIERSIEEIFKQYCQAGDHEKTAQILEYLKIVAVDEETDRLEEMRSKSMEEYRIALNDDLALTGRLIGEAVAQDLLTEEAYTEFSGEIDLIDASDVYYFPKMFSRLALVRKRLEENRKVRISKIKSKLKHAEFSEKEKAVIRELIDADDIGTAEEFMVLLESGESLPQLKGGSDQQFETFFPTFVNQFEGYMSRHKKTDSILETIRKGQRLGPVSMKNVRGAQLKEAEIPIRTWLTAKQLRKIDSKGVATLLSWIGFDTKNVDEIESGADRLVQWFKVSAKILGSCPIPEYGSSAHGNYRLLCVHGRPPEEVVLGLVAGQKIKGTRIVFYFGRMTEAQLRNLSRSARNHPPGALLIDESSIFFLLGERGAKVNTLFRIALPFTSNNPYKPFATGNVPAEMFYGRSREKESILDPHGSCFIYGGRQLGKSALLRAVERYFHRPADQHFAFFLDLKAEGLGESRPVDDIWKILHANLHSFGILQLQFVKQDGSSAIVQDLVDWARTDQGRRLLILLDEADLLLDEDSRDDFIRITAMKKVMDSTDRRVKFVFAGLHNVQRFTKIPNQPLAHLGAPICIGPMLNNGEWREARRLIEAPIGALGYRFEPRHLVNRILAHTNYQPSLIQLFCETLVHHLSDPNRVNFDQRTAPPYVITDKHVDSVYLNTNLRKNIKERFELTLNLDPRYMVIAYVIAHGALDKEEAHREGFSIPWITREVNYWWPRGFAESRSLDDLRGLLEEMIGLGVLTRNEENRYRLRSSNVIRLLGSQKDIEHTLLDASSWELPRKYHSSIFRRGKEAEGIFRSPVTGSQESDLLYLENGIRLVFGSEALGLNSLKKYLDMSKPDTPAGSSSMLSPKVITAGDFKSEIGKVLSRKKKGLNLVFVPPQMPFSERWVEWTSQKVRVLRSQTAICRIFYMFEPDALLVWLKIPEKQRPEFVLKNVHVVSLKRWTESTLERYLNELSLPPNSPSQRVKIMEQTGGWPNLLFRFADLCINKHLSWNEALDRITRQMTKASERDHFLTAVGLPKNTIQHQFMESWSELGEPMSEEDLAGLFDHFSTEDIGTLLAFGEALDLCKQVEEENWQQENLTAKLLLSR